MLRIQEEDQLLQSSHILKDSGLTPETEEKELSGYSKAKPILKNTWRSEELA